MITCTRRLQFCAGHRVLGHENKCAHLHGHNYVVFLTATQVVQDDKELGLDGIGRVVDFSVLKARFGDWIEERWDHGFIVNRTDYRVIEFLHGLDIASSSGVTSPQKLYIADWNPTAENMAWFLGEIAGPMLLKGTEVKLIRVKLYETENCYATWDWERNPVAIR